LEAVRIPPLSDHNAWADFWYYEIGVNVIPADTRKKKTFVEWKQWQTESIPEELHDQWKKEHRFADGLAIILGRVWRGEHIGEYLIFIDCDNLKAIEEFCTRNDETTTLKQIAEKFIVEQHPDDTSKAHIFFYSEIPFTKKSSDINVIDDPLKFKEDRIPAFEIKGRGTHGIAYCTPSIHKNGERYQILGTAMPIKLSEDQANQMMQHIDSICKKYGLQYLENDNGNGNALTPITDLFKDGFAIVEGHNRHLALLRVMDSLISRNYGILSLDKIKRDACEWNLEHCKLPLDDSECEKLWQEATKFIVPQLKKDASAEVAAEKEEYQHQQEPQPQPPTETLPEDLTKEVSWKEIADILSTSIKKDEAPKLITFCGMLLAQTNEDQLNIGFQAESSTGKSYIPIEVASYFPENEIEEIASASPTAFYHDSSRSKWDDAKKALIVDLRHKILIFLDMPGFQLLEKLRPMLSHDKQELHYMITDKNQKFGLRTKNVIIRGYPSVFFCSAKTDPDEQEKTRMLLLSPSTDQEKLKESLELAALRKGNREEYERRIQQDPQRKWLTRRIYGILQWGITEVIFSDNGKAVYDRFMDEHKYLKPRYQRDFPRIFGFIKAHALLNCFNRDKKEGKPDTIIATEADIDAGFKLYKEIEQSNELGLSPYIYKIYEDVVAPLLLESYNNGDGEAVSNQDILKKYYAVRYKTLSPDTLKNVLLQLEAVGLVRQEQDKADRRRTVVYPTVSGNISSLQKYMGSDSGVSKSPGGA
jgi:hypothetical protein